MGRRDVVQGPLEVLILNSLALGIGLNSKVVSMSSTDANHLEPQDR